MPRRAVAVMAVLLPTPMARTVALLLAGIFMATVTLAVTSPVRAAGGNGLREAANEYRASGGLAPVSGTPLLDDIATRRAARMAERDELEHDMNYVMQRLNDAGVCWSGFGEIIAWNSWPTYDYDFTMSQWWNSPTHHDILMGANYNAAGAAWDDANDGGHYSVMVFVTLCGQSATAAPTTILHVDVRYDPDRKLVLKEGRVTAYRLDRSGNVLAQKSIMPSKTIAVTSSGRARAHGKAWLKVSSGALAGYWVHETTKTFVRGLTQKDKFDPARQVALERGRYLGLQFDWLGRVTAHDSHTFGNTRTFSMSAHAIISGRHYFMLSSGPLAGYWVRDTPLVHPV